MRETRLSGSEGGAGQANAPSLPLSPMMKQRRDPVAAARNRPDAPLQAVLWLRFVPPSNRLCGANNKTPQPRVSANGFMVQRRGCGSQGLLRVLGPGA